MRYTHSQPMSPIHRAWLSEDLYKYNEDPTVFSVSELIAPPTITILSRQHRDEMVVEASGRSKLQTGNAVHAAIARIGEKYRDEHHDKAKKDAGLVIIEKRFNRKIEVDGVEYTISGQPDMILPKEAYPEVDAGTGKYILLDNKVTSVWKIIYGSGHDEWIQQLAAYAWIVRQFFDIDYAEIFAILDDWKMTQVGKRQNYPDNIVQSIPFYVGHMDGATEEWIAGRIRAIVKGIADGCTEDERWAKNRDNTDNRCLHYCSVTEWCPYFQSCHR